MVEKTKQAKAVKSPSQPSPSTMSPTGAGGHAGDVSLSRNQKQQLIERMLGLKHKIKVNESGPSPQNHREMAQLMVNGWELEDEAQAIEQVLHRSRQTAVQQKIVDLLRQFQDE